MQEKIEQKQQDASSASLEQARCKYCRSTLPADAIVCPVCHLYSKWWRNQIRIDHVGLLLTCVIITLSFFQYRAARDEREKASDALRRAETVEQSVSEVQSQVKILRDDILESNKHVAELRLLWEAGKQGTEEIAKALQQVRSFQDQMEITRKRMEQIDKRIAEIPSTSARPTLKYLESKFSKSESGLRGIISFQPTSNVQLSAVEFRVTVLPDSLGVITSIGPAVSISLMVSTRISADGRLAQVSYTVVGSGNPAIDIALSGPARLRIEGSPGIQPFEIVAK